MQDTLYQASGHMLSPRRHVPIILPVWHWYALQVAASMHKPRFTGQEILECQSEEKFVQMHLSSFEARGLLAVQQRRRDGIAAEPQIANGLPCGRHMRAIPFCRKTANNLPYELRESQPYAAGQRLSPWTSVRPHPSETTASSALPSIQTTYTKHFWTCHTMFGLSRGIPHKYWFCHTNFAGQYKNYKKHKK